jgi:hypothetical protein
MSDNSIQSDAVKAHKAIILVMAANLIDGLVQILDEDGTELEPLELKINGEIVGQMTASDLSKRVREISNEFKALNVTTSVQDNRTEVDDEE